MDEHVKWVLNQGARELFRRRGFKRPGGGGRFRRRGALTDECVQVAGRAVSFGVFRFHLAAWHSFHGFTLRLNDWRPPDLVLATGDPADFAVHLAHLLDADVLPSLAPAVEREELVARAREVEGVPDLQTALRWWQALGDEGEVERLALRIAQEQEEMPF
jgi:hypothetical protein